MTKTSKWFVSGISAFLCMACFNVANAATFEWNGSISALWTTAANWTLTIGSDVDGIPDADDDIIFPASGAYGSDVDMNGNQACNSLTFNAGTTTIFDIFGVGDVLTITSGGVTRIEEAGGDTSELGMYCDISMPAGTNIWAIAGDLSTTPQRGVTVYGSITTAGTILKTERGRLAFRSANSFGEMPTIGDGIIDIYQPIADVLGTGQVTMDYNGQLGIYGASQTITNDVVITGTKSSGAGIMPYDNIHTYAGHATVSAGNILRFGTSGGSAMILDPVATITGGGDVGVMRSGLVMTSTNQFPDGYMMVGLAGGEIILDGISWGDFTNHYNQGYGQGDYQWDFQGGGFGARTTPLIISAPPGNDTGGTDSKTYFDRSVAIGGYHSVQSAALANAPVYVTVNTELSTRWSWNIGSPYSPPDSTYYTNKANRFEGNITDQVAAGTGSSRGALKLNSSVAEWGHLVLAGTNDWTGSYYQNGMHGDSGSMNSINTGPGGLFINESSGESVYVGIDGNKSLPKGNGGADAWLVAASRYVGTGGFILSSKVGGEIYELPSGYKFLLGSGLEFNGTLGAEGPAGSSATLQGAEVVIQSSKELDVQILNLLARGPTEFHLGVGSKPVTFQPSYGFDGDSVDNGIAGAATVVSNATTARTINMNGDGTVVLDNVDYTQLDGTGDTSAQFSWQLGVPNNTYFYGALRETGTAVNNSVAAFPLSLAGGVLELGAADLARNTSASPGAGDIKMFYGGGFSAYGADRRINLNSGVAFRAGDSGAGFNHGAYPIMFGSRTANRTAILENNIYMLGNTKFAVIRGTGSVPEGRIEGQIEDSPGTFTLIALTTPNGDPIEMGALELAHTNNLITGAYMIEEGTLLVNGGIRNGTAAVTVEDGGILGGTGTVVRPVSVQLGGKLAAGSMGIGTLTIDGDVTLEEGSGVEWEYTANSGDVINITGILTLPTTGVVTCVGSEQPLKTSILMAAGSLAGESDLSNWTIVDAPNDRTYLDIQGTDVYIIAPSPFGTLMIIK